MKNMKLFLFCLALGLTAQQAIATTLHTNVMEVKCPGDPDCDC